MPSRLKRAQAVNTDIRHALHDNQCARVILRPRKPRRGRSDAGMRDYDRGHDAARPHAAAAAGCRPLRRVPCARHRAHCHRLPPRSRSAATSTRCRCRRCRAPVAARCRPPADAASAHAVRPPPPAAARPRGRLARAARLDGPRRVAADGRARGSSRHLAAREGSPANIWATTSPHGRGSAAGMRAPVARQCARVTARGVEGGIWRQPLSAVRARARSDFFSIFGDFDPKIAKFPSGAQAGRRAAPGPTS